MKPSAFNTKIFNLFDQNWAIVTAGTPDRYNSMTISWGSMGTIWGAPNHGRPIVTVYINPLRYTYEVLNESDRFTVSFFPKANRPDLILMGTRTGRFGDTKKGTNLTPVFDDGFVYYRESILTFECEKLYQQTLDKKQIPASIADAFYAPEEQAHRMYIGEVKKIIEKGEEDE
ncbi:flavin reductase [Catenisphaera adipataccumulans]|uniref:Flavin reductase (DIM6/NTAB) family NADH-FMN oxidoreductase RutF n=1 Tax=Catenisphaera adipataccumulans TaxID=700500 RepID=A0A7W8FX92_9FIRM|nr:flavin reductase [Catenisphaera adipataccumulans]MBB5182722.1 flavin reductase (DIM6/NTAB) family NADH-FMN oxidoreductase RutF [Catenisphaera adipataccumulans]